METLGFSLCSNQKDSAGNGDFTAQFATIRQNRWEGFGRFSTGFANCLPRPLGCYPVELWFPPSFTRPLSSRSTCWCANLSLLLRNSCMSHMQLLTKLLWNVGMLESWNAAGSIAPLRHFEGVFDNGRAGVRLPGCCKDDVGPGFKVKACHMCTWKSLVPIYHLNSHW